MNKSRLASLLLITSLLLSACGVALLNDVTPNPTQTSTPHATLPPTLTATPDIPYTELARQAGFIQYQGNESVDGSTFSLWMPESFENTSNYVTISPYGSWKLGQFLAEASKSIDDYAYDLYAENTLFTASDTSFYYGSPDSNQCTELTRTVDVGSVEFAIRTGQDPQLGGMTIENYAGLLAIAIQGMRGDQWMYPQSSEPFGVPGFEAWRIISDFDLPEYNGLNFDATFIDYILKDGDRIWVITFSMDTELFWEQTACAYLHDIFDLIARTFEVFPGAN